MLLHKGPTEEEEVGVGMLGNFPGRVKSDWGCLAGVLARREPAMRNHARRTVVAPCARQPLGRNLFADFQLGPTRYLAGQGAQIETEPDHIFTTGILRHSTRGRTQAAPSAEAGRDRGHGAAVAGNKARPQLPSLRSAGRFAKHAGNREPIGRVDARPHGDCLARMINAWRSNAAQATFVKSINPRSTSVCSSST